MLGPFTETDRGAVSIWGRLSCLLKHSLLILPAVPSKDSHFEPAYPLYELEQLCEPWVLASVQVGCLVCEKKGGAHED